MLISRRIKSVEEYLEQSSEALLETRDDEKNTKSQQLAAIRRCEIDAELAEMTNDREYQEEALLVAISQENAIA